MKTLNDVTPKVLEWNLKQGLLEKEDLNEPLDLMWVHFLEGAYEEGNGLAKNELKVLGESMECYFE